MSTKRAKDRRARTEPATAERRNPGLDRREHERVLVDLEVDYRCEDTFLFAYITDISAMGIFVQTKTPQKPGTRLNLRFMSPAGERMELEGEVIWINPYRPGVANSNPGMGIQFVELAAKQRDRLTQLVRTFAYLDDEDGAPRGNS